MNIEAYQAHIAQPWGQIYYQILFEQLKSVKARTILDFGSGFGHVAQFLARENQVLAIEPNEDLIRARVSDTAFPYEQRQGSLEVLESLAPASFDMIVCHNVLEYVEHPTLYLEAFCRLLKPSGQLSLVKHNDVGRIMQTVVFECDIPKTMGLLAGERYQSHSMGEAKFYEINEVLTRDHFVLEHYQGIRTFYGLQPNCVKTEQNWLAEMMQLEVAVCDQSPYRDIAAFQHLWLRKKG
ncbi:class I SAM-dependent methyltransferase [Streptococcus cuniculi]|uniref:Class I SAM-dependent methyltransferase n=1 Tax=Streptococcus cuniculi TaxID=1432788 RepID=A0A4Y9JBP6_9STRE|nr:class I SAM-dependent methyltransferase [Streptococcus cuniculi]MBF0777795.1 methyltransferase domain-containing protein [Streptococcus cuniculi]TFU98430.1 class I SAM-dependent methyltransferase [Streptococcus cuniculi]